MTPPPAAQTQTETQTETQAPSQWQSPRAKMPLTAVQRTLLITLRARARDCARPDSRLRDEWAAATAARLDHDLAEQAQPSHDPVQQTLLDLTWRGVVLRAAVLDRWTDEFLAQHPAGATVVHLACGLDSRAWRLQPRGSRVRWVDADMPPVVALRRHFFPDPPRLGKGGEYRLVAMAVRAPAAGGNEAAAAAAADQDGDPAWLESIPNDRPTLVIMEGLTMYLAPAAGEALVRRVLAHFASGQLLFDALGPVGTNILGRVMGLGPPRADGGPVGWAITDPEALEVLGPRLALLDVHHGVGLDDLPAPIAFLVASVLTLVPYIPFAPWLLDVLVRLAQRLAQFSILRYEF